MKLNKMREDMKEEFLNALKSDVIPWEGNGRPHNAITGSNYHGLNSFWLGYHQQIKGYTDSRWCTFKQAQDKGWKIKKGEKGVRVEFWSMYDTETKKKLTPKESRELLEKLGDKEKFHERVKPISSVYVVFNGEQIEGIPEITFEKHELDADKLLDKRDVLLKNMGVEFSEGGDRAFYLPAKDLISLPEVEKFKSEYGYMSTFLHEAGHATGHTSRLNRALEGGFGSPSYAKEELRAEIASAFVAQTLGLNQTEAEHLENHKAYVQGWIEVLESEPEELFAAMKDAEKIADYLIEKGEFEIAQEPKIEKSNVIEERENYLTDLRINQGMDGLQIREIRYGLDNNIDVSIYASNDFKFQQMEQIRLGLQNGVDVSVYAHPEFHFQQMEQIREGLEQNLDVLQYARPEFEYLQMEQIKEGLEHGVNVNLYNNPNFDSLQMHIIRDGLENNLDVSLYANPEFDHMQMSLMIDDLQKGLDISTYANPEFDFHQMREISRGLESGVDVSTYNNPEFIHMQMQEILEGLKSGINVSWYADTKYDDMQMAMIRDGLEKDLDVSIYAKPEFNSFQMGELLLGLEQGLDVSIYANPKFDEEKMFQIRKGLENGLDVSMYATQEFNDDQMREIRKGLEEDLDVSIYAKPEIDFNQMEEIRLGLKEDNLVEYTATTEFYGLEQKLHMEIEEKIHNEQNLSFDNRDNYDLIQNVAEMEIKLNIPTEERLTVWYGDYAVFEMKNDVSVGQLFVRYDSFKEHYIPLLSTKDAAVVRLAAKGRSVEGKEAHPEHIQVAEILQKYQDDGLSIKDIISNKLNEIGSQIGSEDILYTKNIVCSIASKDRAAYEEYMRTLEHGEANRLTPISKNLALRLKEEGLDVYTQMDSILHNCEDISSIFNNPEESYFANSKQFDTILKIDNDILPVIQCDLSADAAFVEGKYYTVSEFDKTMGQADAAWMKKKNEILEKYENSNDLLKSGTAEEIHCAMGYNKVRFSIISRNGKVEDRQDIGDGDGSLIQHSRLSLKSQVEKLETAIEKEQNFEKQLATTMEKEIEPDLQDTIFKHDNFHSINNDIFPKDANQTILQQKNAKMKAFHNEMRGMGR